MNISGTGGNASQIYPTGTNGKNQEKQIQTQQSDTTNVVPESKPMDEKNPLGQNLDIRA